MAKETLSKKKELIDLLAQYKEFYILENSGKALPHNFAVKKKKLFKESESYVILNLSKLHMILNKD